MRNFVQVVFLMLLVVGCSIALSASTLDRAQLPTSAVTVTKAADLNRVVNLADLVRVSRPEAQDISGFVCCDRPTEPISGQFTIPTGGGTVPMLTNLSRPVSLPRSPVSAPEPGSLVLLAYGLLSGAYFVRRRR
jgi:hypothetical protein